MKFRYLWKYGEIKPIYVILAVVLAVIIKFWGENSVTLLQKKVPEIHTTEVSGAEIYRYLKVKQEYVLTNKHIDWDYAVRSDYEQIMDQELHKWFLVRKWRPSRFVYTQRRIREILQYIQKREKRLNEAQQMEKQAKQYEEILRRNPNETEAAQYAAKLHNQAHSIYYYKDREIRHAGITEEEEDIVLKNRAALENLIDK